MTTRLTSQCVQCRHFRSPLNAAAPSNVKSCAAYPAAIPDEIWWNEADHRQPHAGDQGIQWESRDGAEFPEYAMNT